MCSYAILTRMCVIKYLGCVNTTAVIAVLLDSMTVFV